jgi:glyoxylase-like metal-dependent hydrolase (beta-lactamase superfamily II)
VVKQRGFAVAVKALMEQPQVTAFYDRATGTFTYVVCCSETLHCAVIDPVLDLDYASGTISVESADQITTFITEHQYQVSHLLETHVHADHLSAAPYLKSKLGGKIAIGDQITGVQQIFSEIFNEGPDFVPDGRQFDLLFGDGHSFNIGKLEASAFHVPGHTPACMAYLIGDALFVGDTLFMPNAGTARCDFPGGDAKTLYRSIQKLLALPPETRVFVCHDYPDEGEQEHYETTIAHQREHNVHVGGGIPEEKFIAMREARDKTLRMPGLILPSLQVNMRAGRMPPTDQNNRLFLKVPINAFGGTELSTLLP